MHMAGEGRLRGEIPLNDDRTSRQVIRITCAGETSPKTASQNSSLPFSSARAAMADAGINFFNFHGMAWLSRVSTATCCGVSLAPFCAGETAQQAAGAGVAVCGPCCSRHRGGGVHPRSHSASRRARRASFLNMRPKGTLVPFFPGVLPPLKCLEAWILYRF